MSYFLLVLTLKQAFIICWITSRATEMPFSKPEVLFFNQTSLRTILSGFNTFHYWMFCLSPIYYLANKTTFFVRLYSTYFPLLQVLCSYKEAAKKIKEFPSQALLNNTIIFKIMNTFPIYTLFILFEGIKMWLKIKN